jgi:membrane-bound ClpP family serine protease
MMGETGVVLAAGENGCPMKVFMHGEIWLADSNESLEPCQRIRVVSMIGLRLRVTKEDGKS